MPPSVVCPDREDGPGKQWMTSVCAPRSWVELAGVGVCRARRLVHVSSAPSTGSLEGRTVDPTVHGLAPVRSPLRGSAYSFALTTQTANPRAPGTTTGQSSLRTPSSRVTFRRLSADPWDASLEPDSGFITDHFRVEPTSRLLSGQSDRPHAMPAPPHGRRGDGSIGDPGGRRIASSPDRDRRTPPISYSDMHFISPKPDGVERTPVLPPTTVMATWRPPKTATAQVTA